MTPLREVIAAVNSYVHPEARAPLLEQLHRAARLGMVLTIYRDAQGRPKLNVETFPEARDPDAWVEVLYEYPLDLQALTKLENAAKAVVKVRIENRVRITALTYARNERKGLVSAVGGGADTKPRDPSREYKDDAGDDPNEGETIH